jgi:major membrane immunogen (membrane-anchored lipoprotein)
MFKKLLLVFVLALATLSLTACEKGVEIDAADGVYTAFEPGLTSGGAEQITTVTITVKGGRIASYYIDCRQGSKGGTAEAPVYTFNAETKKELGYQYAMHNSDNAEFSYVKQDLNTDAGLAAYKAYLKKADKKEWFEQAEELEKFFFKNGPETAKVNDKNVFVDVAAGVTIKDGSYTKLAKEAIKLAEEGKAQVVTTDKNSIIWVTAKVAKDGKFTELELNTLQGKLTEGKWAWNAKNKQELGYAYNMHNPRVAGVLTYDTTTTEGIAAYKAYMAAQTPVKKEWFEQADMLTDYVLVNGVSNLKVKAVGAEGAGKLDAAPTALSAVSITASEYLNVLTKLYANFK